MPAAFLFFGAAGRSWNGPFFFGAIADKDGARNAVADDVERRGDRRLAP